MVRNPIQFQLGLTVPAFLEQYGTAVPRDPHPAYAPATPSS